MNQFWTKIDVLIASGRIVIERPAGSHHPRFPSMVYPVDYGYVTGTVGGDGAEVDVWVGTAQPRITDAILCTVDMLKKDLEVKVLIGCSAQERQSILEFMNGSQNMSAIVVERQSVA